jgi:hypothetical protein
MAKFLKDMNDLSGIFILLIAVFVGWCVSLLAAIKSEIQCLHEDFNTIHDAHRRWEPNP